jgi:hypothetical protein
MMLTSKTTDYTDSVGSHMPLDTDVHWNWRNPITYLVVALIALWVVALIGVLV